MAPDDSTLLFMNNQELMTTKVKEVMMSLFKKFGVAPTKINMIDQWVVPDESKLPTPPNAIYVSNDSTFNWDSDDHPEYLMIISKLYPDKPEVAFLTYKLRYYQGPVSPSVRDRLSFVALLSRTIELIIEDACTEHFPNLKDNWEIDKDRMLLTNSINIETSF